MIYISGKKVNYVFNDVTSNKRFFPERLPSQVEVESPSAFCRIPSSCLRYPRKGTVTWIVYNAPLFSVVPAVELGAAVPLPSTSTTAAHVAQRGSVGPAVPQVVEW